MFYVLLVLSSLVSPESASCHFRDETLPIPMYGHLGIFSATKNAVYVFGGKTNGETNLLKVYKWDLSDPSSWFVEIGNTPNTGFFYSFNKNVVLVNDTVFFIGIAHDTRSTGKIFVYDLNTESFISEEKTPMPNPLINGCLATNTTHIFMVDGYDESGSSRLPIIQVYDVAADAWQSQVLDAGPLTTGGWRLQYCSLVGDALYVLGGYIAGDSYIDGIYRINTRTLAIEELTATLPSPQGYGVSIYDGDHNLYLFGAYPYKQDVVTLDLDTFSASTAFLSQQQFSSAPVLTINGSIYRFGGDNNYVAFDEVEICDLPTDMPTQSPTKPPTNATNSPTSIPTAPPSNLPTSVPSLIPSQSPTKKPTIPPSAIPSNAPTDNPSSIPTTVSSLMSTRTDNFPNDSTIAPTNLSTRPPTPVPHTREYGVDITIKLDTVLLSNDELITALREYARNTVNATNCSERINVSSQQTEDDSKTVMKIWIITCSESTEKQLLVAFADTVLVYDIIGGVVAEAEVDEIDIEGIYDSSTKSDNLSTPNEKFDWLVIVVIVLVICLSGVMIRKCYIERKIGIEREMEEKVNHDVVLSAEHDDNDHPVVEPGALVMDDDDSPAAVSFPESQKQEMAPAVTAGGYAQEHIANDEFVIEEEDDDANRMTATGGMIVANNGEEAGEQ